MLSEAIYLSQRISRVYAAECLPETKRMIRLSVEKISSPFTKLISYRHKHKSQSNLLKETDFTPELENITRLLVIAKDPSEEV